MSRRVADLSGAELALLVARSQGWTFGAPHKVLECDVWRDSSGEIVGVIPAQAYAPHEDWAQGGPLIEKHGIIIAPIEGGWCAFMPKGRAYKRGAIGIGYIDIDLEDADGFGDTPLIGAMRALVASVYGNEVPDEVAP